MYTEQRKQMLAERNERVMHESLVYLKKKYTLTNYQIEVKVESLDGNFNDISVIDNAIKNLDGFGLYSSFVMQECDNSLIFCQKICDALFLALAEHFADSDIEITTQERSGAAITVHYRSKKPSLTIKI